MLNEHNKATLTDLAGRNDISVDVNGSGIPESSVRMTLDGNSAFVSIDELFNLVYVLVDTSKRDDMTPVRQTIIRKHMRQHHVVATKGIKKGDKLVVNCEIDIPETVINAFAGTVKNNKKGLGISDSGIIAA